MTQVTYHDYVCPKTGEEHVLPWQHYANEPCYCNMCKQRIWIDIYGWFVPEFLHGIEEEPW